MKSSDLNHVQREMPFLMILSEAKWASRDQVESFMSFRDAVVWSWENRCRKSSDADDQAAFARKAGVHAPHMSRYVNPATKAPMYLKLDLIRDFEAYTGWRAITQYLAMQSSVTLMEQVIEERRAA